MAQNVENQYLVDPATGEISNYAVLPNPEEVIVTSKKTIQSRKEYYEHKTRIDLFQEIAGSFTFIYTAKMLELVHDSRFTDDEKARILFLGTFVNYSQKGSLLSHRSNGKLINKKKLKKLLEIPGDKKFYDFYNKIKNAGIITEVPYKNEIALQWSTDYHKRGATAINTSHNDNPVIKAYDKQIQELYKAKKPDGKSINTPRSLFLLFLILPYIHFETNMLCRYPNNPIHTCEPFNLKELAEVLGFSRTNDLKKKLLKIKIKEQPVISILLNETGNKHTNLTVNPFVIWRSKNQPNDLLLAHYYDTAKRIAEAKGLQISLQDLTKVSIVTVK